PTMFLLVVLLVLPEVRLRVGQIKGVPAVPVPGRRRAGGFGVALVVVALLFSTFLSDVKTGDVALGLVYGIVMLSLVLLTGYGGYFSLAQFSFAGIGAIVASKWLPGSALSLLLAAVIAGGGGGAVALT